MPTANETKAIIEKHTAMMMYMYMMVFYSLTADGRS